MGLAGTKVKQRFGTDPRNTNWSNNTSRFGHQYLEKLGWKPGKGLGLVQHATTTHVKVSNKDDTVGLGAKLRKKHAGGTDDDDSHGLDVFQRILGRLNGKEEQIEQELERQRKERVINGKMGIHFVKGDVLKSTWDTESKKLKADEKKRKAEEDPKNQKKKKQKREVSDKPVSEKRKHKDSTKSEKTHKIDKLKKKEKKEAKEKRSKKETKDNRSKEDSEEKKDKKQKKEKKHKKDKSKSSAKEEKEEKRRRSGGSTEKESAPESSGMVATRLSARAKYIRQKKASVMDPKLLNEIFMITN